MHGIKKLQKKDHEIILCRNQSQLIDALKRELRKRRITYKQVAAALDLSEPSVKRLFAGRFFTLERLEKICELLGIGFNDLVQ